MAGLTEDIAGVGPVGTGLEALLRWIRPTFDLANQLARMDRARGNSDMDSWFGQIAIFMRGTAPEM